MIVRDETKMTVMGIKKLVTRADALVNYGWRYRGFKIEEILDRIEMLKIHSNDHIPGLGKPNLTVREWESNPGVWVYYDTQSTFIWMVISDGWKKKSYKGTNYEVIVPEGFLDENVFVKSVKDFFHFLGFKVND